MTTESTAPWFASDSRARVAAVVQRVESRTSAEIVVTVRAASDRYRDADMIAGTLLALVTLLIYLYFPLAITPDLAGPAVVVAFALGFLLSASVPPVRRVLLARVRQRAAVRAAAREAFFDQSIATTRGRTGVLVFVSLLERRVDVVLDVGVANAPLPDGWSAAVADLERSLEPGASLERFEQALAALAAPLSQALPRQTGDTNELPDEVHP
jgi:putative membrane protein